MNTHVVVLGAGFAGLELSTILSDTFGDAIDILLIDKSESFVFGFSKLSPGSSRTWCRSGARTANSAGFKRRSRWFLQLRGASFTPCDPLAKSRSSQLF